MPLLDGTYVFRRQHSPGLGFDDKGPVQNSIYASPPGRTLTRHSGGRAKDKFWCTTRLHAYNKMEQPMLSLEQRKDSTVRVTPNILPCRVYHDGPVGSAASYWAPSTTEGRVSLRST